MSRYTLTDLAKDRAALASK